MAENKKAVPKSKAPRRRKQTETVRDRADKQQLKAGKEPRRKKLTSRVRVPIAKVGANLKKEFHPVKLPDNKTGRFLSKKRSFWPRYFIDSWRELRQVEWPNRSQTTKLTIAVFIFAIVFSAIVKVIDIGYEKIFKAILLK